MKTMYINQLPNTIQEDILKELSILGFSTEDIDNAMNSRLCDLSDTININKYL